MDRGLAGDAITLSRQPPSRRDLLAVAVLLMPIAAMSWERLHYAEWLRRPDVINAYMPWWSHLGDELRAGNIPGWNPYQLGGTPFVGDPQTGWMYLPVMIVFSATTLMTGMKAYVVVQLLIAGLSMYWFARLIALGPLPSLVAAYAFALGPFLQHTTYCCNVQGHIEAWLPLGLIGVELIYQSRRWSTRLLGWGLSGLAISQMIAGSIGQGSYDGLLVIGSYLGYRLLLAPGVRRLNLLQRLRLVVIHGVAVLAVGFALSAAALLPLLDVNSESNLKGGEYQNVEEGEQRGASLDTAVARLIAPDFTNRRTTIGMVTLALVFIAPVFARRRSPVIYFVALTVAVQLLTLRQSYGLRTVFDLLPRFKELHDHAPHRTLAVAMIGPAVLAGIAMEAIPRFGRKRALYAAATPLVGISLLGAVLSSDHRWLLSLSQPTMKAALAAALLIALLGLIRGSKLPRGVRERAPTAIPILLIALMLWEPNGRDVLDHLRNSPVRPRTDQIVHTNMDKTESNSAGEFLQIRLEQSDAPFRYVGYNAINLRTAENELGITYQNRFWSTRYRRILIGPRSIVLRIYHLQGYNPVQLARTVDLFETINRGLELDYHDAVVLPRGISSPWLDLLNVRYFVVPPDTFPGRPDLLHLTQRHPVVFDTEHVRVLRNPEVYPYAWVVHEVRTIEVEDDDTEPATVALVQVELGLVDPRSVALLEPGVELPDVAEPAEGASESVTVDDYQADEIHLSAHLDTAGVVVISEIYYPGWKVYVDGERADLLAVDGALRGVAVAAGDHEIELRYDPISITAGLAITGVTTVALIGGILLLRRRERFRRSGATPGSAAASADNVTMTRRPNGRRLGGWFRLRLRTGPERIPRCPARSPPSGLAGG